MKYKVVISEQARLSLELIYLYLLKTSTRQTAKRIKNDLIAVAKSLQSNPRRFPRIEISKRIPYEVRSVLRWSYRIIYSIREEGVIILEISHASREDSKKFPDD